MGHDREHDLRSYGRRRGRAPSARQASLWQEALPRYALDLSQPLPQRLGELFAARSRRLARDRLRRWRAFALAGEGQPQCRPNRLRAVPGRRRQGAECDRRAAAANIRLHADDARPLLRRLPEASIGRVFILFPDPWPKARHHKRRLVSAATVVELARIMRAGAELRIATDDGDYARWILLAVLGHRDFAWMATGAADWRQRPPDWPPTRYEQKALNAGRRCYYFRFRRG